MVNVKRLEQIIAKERPDALLPNLGGQSGLNLCAELAKEGILDKYNVKVIGVQVDAIERGEDRIEFKKSMNAIGIEMARSEVAYSVDEALAIADQLGYPVVLRPAYTMGGAGGGLVYNKEELKTVCARGLQASLVGQVLVEESILGWEELELEVVRDCEGNMITVCFIENIDPLGVHTGDSFCSAPMLTISEDVQKRLQEQAYKIVDSVEVIGGTNVQFAHDPVSDRIIVIEINPRTSRSSALASKATGFPIALVSAMLATGLTLKDIECGKYGTLDKYVPDGDYVVIKFARWAFEKFKGVEDKLGTQMRAVGEVMSIGKTYKEAFQKAIRSLETGRYGLGYAKDYNTKSKDELLRMLAHPSSDRHFIMYEALRKGATVDEIFDITKVKHYFVEQMKELVEEEEALAAHKGSLPSDEALTTAKKDGFSDRYLSQILEIPEEDIRNKRIELGVTEAWEGVHVSGTKDSAYYYSTYNAPDSNPINENKPKVSDHRIKNQAFLLCFMLVQQHQQQRREDYRADGCKLPIVQAGPDIISASSREGEFTCNSLSIDIQLTVFKRCIGFHHRRERVTCQCIGRGDTQRKRRIADRFQRWKIERRDLTFRNLVSLQILIKQDFLRCQVHKLHVHRAVIDTVEHAPLHGKMLKNLNFRCELLFHNRTCCQLNRRSVRYRHLNIAARVAIT